MYIVGKLVVVDVNHGKSMHKNVQGGIKAQEK